MTLSRAGWHSRLSQRPFWPGMPELRLQAAALSTGLKYLKVALASYPVVQWYPLAAPAQCSRSAVGGTAVLVPTNIDLV